MELGRGVVAQVTSWLPKKMESRCLIIIPKGL